MAILSTDSIENSAENSAPVARKPAYLRSATTNGTRPFALGGDGRGVWVRRWKDIVDMHVSDLGGSDLCSEAQLSLCRRISATTVEIERLEARMSTGDDTVDLDLYNRLAGNLRRMLESIGLQRISRDVTPNLAHYLDLTAKREAAE